MASGGSSPVPRRRGKSNSIKRGDGRSDVEILLQMGFPKLRVEKALAATGNNGVQLASDWLLSHVNDQTLDDNTPRQYVLYLCPVGKLQEQLMAFWEKSLATCGWNGTHSYFPHITLCSFFSVENQKSRKMKEALVRLRPILERCPGNLCLDFFSQTNFIGLFVSEQFYTYLSNVVNQFGADVKSHGVEFEGPKKQLHVTLAYQYSKDNHEELEMLARQIDLSAECNWELRLYSRDPRVGKCEVRNVLKAYKGVLEDELDLILGDYVFMDPNESARSEDAWYMGTSWLTGQSGMFPGPYTKRTSETWTWALHGSLALHQKKSEIAENGSTSVIQSAPVVKPRQPIHGQRGPISLPPAMPITSVNHMTPPPSNPPDVSTNALYQAGFDGVHEGESNKEDLYAKIIKKKPNSVEKNEVVGKQPRQIFIIRHGERVDFLFGRQWCDQCFDNDGKYTQLDLNMQSTLPKRSGNHLDYVKDCPLTSVGSFQAFLTGEALRGNGTVFHHVYVSPAFRCVQTAQGILKSMGISPPMKVEPGIFEWLGWYQMGLPRWFPAAELKVHGFNVDAGYKPIVATSHLDMDEDIVGYYRRSGSTVKKILKNHENEGGNILIVGHAGSAEVCTRELIGKQIRSPPEFREICPKVPYCGLICCEEDVKTKKWVIKDTPILPLTLEKNKKQTVKEILYPPA